MTEALPYLAYLGPTLILYCIARRAKRSFSGRHLSSPKYYLLLFYNGSLCYLHYRFSETGNLPFYGPWKDPVLSLLAFIMAILHAMSLPTEYKQRPLRQRFGFRPKIKKHRISFSIYKTEHQKKSRLLFWKK